jgi:hypothetical protein
MAGMTFSVAIPATPITPHFTFVFMLSLKSFENPRLVTRKFLGRTYRVVKRLHRGNFELCYLTLRNWRG